MERLLQQMAIAYESEVGFKPYWVDIYLPEWHLAIEIDGPQHSPAKDAKRDAYLREKYYLPVLRLKTNLKPDIIKSTIENYINTWAETGQTRKRQYRQDIP